MLFVLLVICCFAGGSVDSLLLRIGILRDHYAEEFFDAVYNSVERFSELVDVEDDVIVEPVTFNLEENTHAYDELLDYNLTAIITVAKKLKCKKIASLKKTIPIYIVTGSFKSCDETEYENSLIYLYPSDSVVVSAMLMAAESYKWNSAIVLGEKNKEFDFTFTSMQQARERGLTTLAFEITIDESSLRQTLTSAKREGIRAFILMCQLHHVKEILSAARDLEITDKNFHWFIPNMFVLPEALKTFVDNGMTISLLYSPILTPLIYKIEEKESENVTEAFLMNEVISSLTLLALDVTLHACEKAMSTDCITDKDVICKPSKDDVLVVMDANPTTITYSSEPTAAGHGHDVTEATTTTTTGMMHGHGITTTTGMMHGHGTTTTAGMTHGHGTTTTTGMMDGHGTTTTAGMMDGHGATEATTSTTGMMDGHGATEATTTTTGMMDGHGATEATAATAGMVDGHGATEATTTTTGMMDGHGAAEATTTTTGMMEGHGPAETTTTTTPMMDGHGATKATTTTTGMMDGHSATEATTTTTGMMDGHGATEATTATAGMMDGHGATEATTTTTSMMDGHGAAEATTTTTGMMDGHDATEATTTKTSMMGGHGVTEATTTTTGMMDGHDATEATTTKTSMMGGHGVTEATTTTTGMMDGHDATEATTTTTGMMDGHGVTQANDITTTATMHGHMKRRSIFHEEEKVTQKSALMTQKHYINSHCTRKTCFSGNKQKIRVSATRSGKARNGDSTDDLSRRKRETNDLKNAMDPNPACTVYDWEDQTIFAAAKVVETTLFPEKESSQGDNETTASPRKASHSSTLESIHYLATNVDSCRFTSTHKWNYENDTCSLQMVKDSEILFSNNLYVVEYSATKNLKRAARKYQVKDPIIVGVFNNEKRFYMDSIYEPLQTYNVFLPERDLLVGAIYHPPWLSWEIDEETNETIYSGYLYEILDHLSKSMNFSYQLLKEYDFPGDLHFEKELESYMMAVFNNNSVDFFLHAKSVHGNRLGKSDTVLLSASFQQPHMYLITKRVEKTESVSIWQFMMPFREESWIVFWSSFILVSLLMAYMNKKNPNEYQAIAHTFGPNSEPSDHLGILNSLWFNFAAICGQGADIVPRSSACVVLTGAWWGFLLLVVSAYTANMTAFMTQVNSGGIETLNQLAGQQEFAYGIMDNSAMLNLFLPDARDAPYTTMFDYFHKDENASVFRTQSDAFRRVLEGNFFLVAEFETVVDALTQTCDIDIKGDGFYQYQFALPFPRGSVYIQMFNDHIKKLRDKGVLADLEKKWFTLESRCETEVLMKNLENQLDIKAFTGMYVFLILGITAGMVICAVETGWIKYGGIMGLLGRAGIYELHTEKKELQKANELLEKEFESWEGGWKVWKFMEWKEGGYAGKKSDVFTPPPKSGKSNCKTCGKHYKDSKFKAEPPILSGKIVEDSIKETKIEMTKEGDSDDSGRESASSGQLTIPESVEGEHEEPGAQTGAVKPPSPAHKELPKQEIDNKASTTMIPAQNPRLRQLVVEAVLHQQPKAPLESFTPVDSRLESALSGGSISHSSLASGTLSFLSDSDVSVSTIHPRTPFPDSRSSSRFAESALTFDLESELYTPSSLYSTTSFGTESSYSTESPWGRSMQQSTNTYTDEYTDDTRSDITVISRRRYK